MRITILGGGPGGYAAAIYAAKQGADVILIEKDKVGGTCLNRGCIPTKALLASYEVYQTVENSKVFGIMTNGEITVDYPAMIERKNKVASNLVKGIHYLLDKNGVNYIDGFGRLSDKHTIDIAKNDGTAETLQTDFIILATGSVPNIPKAFKYDGRRVITSDEILEMTQVPRSVIIAGGGVIGCEIGQFISKMGAEVTIVEQSSQILPTMDADVAKQLTRQFAKEKIKMITGDGIKDVIVNDFGVRAKLQSGKELEAEYLLVATGRISFTKGAGLEELGIEITDRGNVKVNAHLQTNVDNIYAIGDIIDTPMLAHVASKEGLIAVNNIVSDNKKIPTYHAVPDCVYTNPEIACVGFTETQLKKTGTFYNVGTYDFRALGKAQASGKIGGFVKVITDENDVIIGAAITGTHATDMLQVLTTAVQMKLTSKNVGDCMFPHPTMSEAIMEALHDLYGESIHKA